MLSTALNPSSITTMLHEFDELKRVLEYYGYESSNPASGSSHYTFRKAGKPKITISKHASIKVVYVRAVKAIVEGEENENEES